MAPNKTRLFWLSPLIYTSLINHFGFQVLGMFHQRQSIIVAKLDKSEMPKFFLLNYNLDLIKKKPTKANENFFTELLYQRFPLIREHVSDLNLSNEQLVLWFDRNIVALMHIKMSITQIQQKYVIPYNTTIFGFFADLLRYVIYSIIFRHSLILQDSCDFAFLNTHFLPDKRSKVKSDAYNACQSWPISKILIFSLDTRISNSQCLSRTVYTCQWWKLKRIQLSMLQVQQCSLVTAEHGLGKFSSVIIAYLVLVWSYSIKTPRKITIVWNYLPLKLNEFIGIKFIV